jgi:hypothetical protein
MLTTWYNEIVSPRRRPGEHGRHITRKMSVEMQWLDEDTRVERRGYCIERSHQTGTLSLDERKDRSVLHRLCTSRHNTRHSLRQQTERRTIAGNLRRKPHRLGDRSDQRGEPHTRPRVKRSAEYEAAGIGEYWIIDPENQLAEFYQLQPEGRFALALPDAEGIYESSRLHGFRLRVDWLWRTPRPRPSQFPSFGE